MKNFSKKNLLLLVLFVVLISIPMSFAADGNTQIQTDDTNSNIETIDDTSLITKTGQTTDNINIQTDNKQQSVNNEEKNIHISRNKNLKGSVSGYVDLEMPTDYRLNYSHYSVIPVIINSNLYRTYEEAPEWYDGSEFEEYSELISSLDLVYYATIDGYGYYDGFFDENGELTFYTYDKVLGPCNFTVYALYDNQIYGNNSTIITFDPLPAATKIYENGNEIIYKNQNITVFEIVYDQYDDWVSEGTVTVYLDNQIVNTDTPGGSYDIPTANLSLGIHNITIKYEDENGEYPSNETSYTINLTDIVRSDITFIKPDYVLTSDDSFNVSFNVIDYYSKNKIRTGTLDVYMENYINNKYILLKTFNMDDDKVLTINVSSMISNHTPTNSYYHSFLLMYHNITEKITNETRYMSMDVYAPSNNTVEIPDMEAATNMNIIIPVTVKDVEGNVIDSDVRYVDGFCVEKNRSVNKYFNKDGQINITSYYFTKDGTYNIEWLVHLKDRSVKKITSKVIIDSRPKTVFKNITDITIIKGQKELNLSLDVYDERNKQIKEGNITIRFDDAVLANLNLNDTNNYTIALNDVNKGNHNITIVYEDKLSRHPNNNTSFIITIENPITNINIKDMNLTTNQNNTITAFITDQLKNEITGGKVVFKVNGKTLKDENGKVIYVRVVDGQASINYMIPQQWDGKNITITAVYSGYNEYNAAKNNTQMHISKPTPKITVTQAQKQLKQNTSLTIKAQITLDENPVTTGKVLFKINGKTIKDEDGKIIYVNVDENGEVNLNYNIGNLKTKDYTITLIYIDNNYNRCMNTTEITVIKA